MPTILFFLPLLTVYTVLAVYAERKVSAFIQDRYGPMETGKYGLIQTVADLMKLMQKEDIVPASADRKLFLLAPVFIFVAIFTGYAMLPLGPGWAGSLAETGVFLLLAVVSLDVVGILMAGWGANNKFTLYGAMRSVAQIVSYEVPMGLSVLCVVMLCQTLDLQEISYQQSILPQVHQGSVQAVKQYLFGLPALGIDVSQVGGFLTWNVVRMPLFLLVYLIFFIAGLAESNRVPFDLPESESEIIGGFHTEYSGFRWAVVMLSEYAMMLLLSFLGVILFLGSWNTPLPNIGPVQLANWTSGTAGTWTADAWGAFWLVSKVVIVIVIHIWIRFTYPRLRVDQLMALCWKYLTPAALLLLLLTGMWRLWMVGS